MFAYVKGIIDTIEEDNVVVDVHDVGMNIRVSGYTVSKLPGIGEMVKLYTYTCVREDAFLLYGFLSKGELELFKKCITVNGIGPKNALSILSVMDVDSLRYAIISGDKKAIAKAPGIGAKTAERLVLELKDKVTIDDAVIQREIDGNASNTFAVDTDEKREAIEALVSLGYGQMESTKAVNSIENIESMDAGKILKAALKKMF